MSPGRMGFLNRDDSGTHSGAVRNRAYGIGPKGARLETAPTGPGHRRGTGEFK